MHNKLIKIMCLGYLYKAQISCMAVCYVNQLCCHIIWKGISLFAFLTYDKGISFIFQTAKTVKELGTSKITIRLKQGQLYFFLAKKKN